MRDGERGRVSDVNSREAVFHRMEEAVRALPPQAEKEELTRAGKRKFWSIIAGSIALWLLVTALSMTLPYIPPAEENGMPLMVCGWFFLGFIFMIPFLLLMSLPFWWLARKTDAYITWLVMLLFFGVLMEAALHDLDPRAHLQSYLGEEIAEHATILSFREADSFNAGMHASGTLLLPQAQIETLMDRVPEDAETAWLSRRISPFHRLRKDEPHHSAKDLYKAYPVHIQDIGNIWVAPRMGAVYFSASPRTHLEYCEKCKRPAEAEPGNRRSLSVQP